LEHSKFIDAQILTVVFEQVDQVILQVANLNYSIEMDMTKNQNQEFHEKIDDVINKI
jgi:hypothetical protein